MLLTQFPVTLIDKDPCNYGTLAHCILMICETLKILWHFDILGWESMGNPKMWSISSTANHSMKHTKIWNSSEWSTICMLVSFHLRVVAVSLGLFGALTAITALCMLRLTKWYSFPIFELISAKLYENIGNHVGIQAVSFLGELEFIKNLLDFLPD